MIAAVLVCVLLNFVTIGYGFFSSIIANKHVCERRTVSIGRENGLMLHAAAEEDPNFEAHLPSMLKAVIIFCRSLNLRKSIYNSVI